MEAISHKTMAQLERDQMEKLDDDDEKESDLIMVTNPLHSLMNKKDVMMNDLGH